MQLLLGDCLDQLATLSDACVDAVVTDPPYGLSFMGKRWDYDVPSVAIWQQVFRVLKPGGHLLAFAGTRTQHRMAVNIEDAGFEIRDMIAWVYGSGFPKSRDISKDMDRMAGAEREIIGTITAPGMARTNVDQGAQSRNVYTFDKLGGPVTNAAQQWEGWGTALKPALEPITVARKPFRGTVAANVLEHGTGALNIDGCRVGDGTGRWPANLIHDGSDDVVRLFPEANSARIGNPNNPHRGVNHTATSYGQGDGKETHDYRDSGSAARFFYCAKCSKADRGEGNTHPTVKPTELMRYLCRLVTPPGGIVLDPFMGSGSTGKAAVLEGFGFVGVEREPAYLEVAQQRITAATPCQPPSFLVD